MSIEQFVSRRMNPFTRKEFEGVDLERICLPESPGSFVRLEAGPLEPLLAKAHGCRVGGPPVIREGKRFVAQLDFDELAPIHGGALGLPRHGYLVLFVDAANPKDWPTLEYYPKAPDVGAPAPGRLVHPHWRAGDVVAEKDFEESVDAELVHRVGWSFWRWGGHWINAAISKELKAAGLDGSLESLRAAEAKGVDVIALIKGANRWRHLWSVACDENLGMDWGDGGRLEFMIRDEHLANADFAKASVDVDPFS